MNRSHPVHEHERRIRSLEKPLERILELVRVLRGPGGCPWDRDQTLESMTPYLQEETFEVVETIGDGNPEAFREELGDLLFLVLFLAELGEEREWGGVEEAADAVIEKLVRRHPHVFAGGDALESEGALRQWEELKQAEKGLPATAGEEPPSTLGKRPPGLPALTTAFRISEKAGAVGFQWPGVDEALAKLREETGELEREIHRDGDRAAIENELGDVLYSVANIARYLGVDPERALRGTIGKFMKRFRYVESKLHEEGTRTSAAPLDRMTALWEEAKRED